jgi:dTDP-glucose 4,6-dehydratase (EC 4.2.1.46)
MGTNLKLETGFVEDFCEALYTIIKKGISYEVYNICAHQFATVKDIVTKIVELMKRDVVKDIVYVKSRPGEDRRYAMKCDKIIELDWKSFLGRW